METRKKRCLINSVDYEMRFNSVPKTHQAEGKKITDDRGGVTIGDPATAPGGQQEAHVNMVAKPERKGYMPAIPKIPNIARQKRAIEIFGRMNSEKIAESDGKSAVTGEIEKEVEAIRENIPYDCAEGCY